MNVMSNISLPCGKLTFEKNEAIACITMECGASCRSADSKLLSDLLAALRDADADPLCQVVILRGANAQVCSEDDMADGAGSDRNRLNDFYREAVSLLDDLRPVTIAVDNGQSDEDGFGLTQACDLVIAASPSATGPVRIGWAAALSTKSKAKLGQIVEHIPSIEAELSRVGSDQAATPDIQASSQLGSGEREALQAAWKAA